MHYQYKTRCSLDNLKGIREFVKTCLLRQRLSDDLLNTVVLALDEVCANVMIHAHGCNPDDYIEVHIMNANDKMLIFEIIDNGYAFDINGFQEDNLTTLIRSRKKGGLGIRIVKSIMDKIEYDMREGKNICRLIKMIER